MLNKLSTLWILSGAACLAVMGVGCEDRTADSKKTTTTKETTTTHKDTTPTTTPAPDNTGKNERDRDGAKPTPIDQGESESDRKITADIRKDIMGDKAMSINAQNVKIITRSGIVTLRGPVETIAEKNAIEGKARAVAGVTSVVNELEVKKP